MNNLWFNIRFGTMHWQWGPDGMTFEHNPAQVKSRLNNPIGWKWFAVYVMFGVSL